MGKEDQVEEREVLDSIFPDEITDIDETSYKLSVTLDTTNDDGDDSEPPTIIMFIEYPPEYPDVPPNIDLLPPSSTSPHTYFNLSSDKESLLSTLETSIQENLGMAMIFTLYSTLKENAEALITSRQAASREAHEQRILAQEEAENQKFRGEPVTPESFERWRLEFLKEMEEKNRVEEEAEEEREKKKRGGKELVDKLTGKQLFERGLVGKVDDEEEEGADLVAGVDKLKVAA